MNNFEMVTENIIKNDAITFKNVKSNWEQKLTIYQVFKFCSTFIEQELEQKKYFATFYLFNQTSRKAV